MEQHMKIDIKAEPRSLQGTGASRRLRRESKVPGILYGAGKDAQPIQLSLIHISEPTRPY